MHPRPEAKISLVIAQTRIASFSLVYFLADTKRWLM